MVKPTKNRECIICRKTKQTTNTETPFICETPCLRTKGRRTLLSLAELISETKKVVIAEQKAVKLAHFIVGIIIGLIVYGIIQKFF